MERGDAQRRAALGPDGTLVIVPLVARGRVLGVLAAGFDHLATQDEDERSRCSRTSARRAALALDSARLYAERDHVARTLQRSLLPRRAARRSRASSSPRRYLAAGDGNEVGGDFYDCFATGAATGRW